LFETPADYVAFEKILALKKERGQATFLTDTSNQLGSSLAIIHLMRMRRLRFRSCSSIFHNAWLASSFLSLPSRKASSRQLRKKIGWAIF
jgi:hypothetical protein